MRSNEDKDRFRRRAVRDLIIAAVLIVVVLAYFIPTVSAGIQDLSLSRRRSSYRTEEIRFSSENVLLAERLREISLTLTDVDFIELTSGQKMDRETAEKTALEEAGKLLDISDPGELTKLFLFYRDVLANGNWSANSSAGMAVNLETKDPFILWVCSFSFTDGFDLAVILDENSGKALSMVINDWDGRLVGWYFSNTVDSIGANLADYYGMTLAGVDIYAEYPSVSVTELQKEGETVRIPVIFEDTVFSVNSPEIRGILAEYGLPAEILTVGTDIVYDEAEEAPEEADGVNEAVDDGKNG